MLERFAKFYRGIVANRLKAAGLRYDDLLIESTDVAKALTRIDHSTLVDRQRRIKRAFDLSAKRKDLAEECQTENPYQFYLNKRVELAKREREEKELLSG